MKSRSENLCCKAQDGLVFKRSFPSLNFTGYKVFSLPSLSLTTVGVERAYIKKSILKVKRQRFKQKKEGELMGSDLLKSQIGLMVFKCLTQCFFHWKFMLIVICKK